MCGDLASIYVTGLVFRWLLDNGGLAAFASASEAKSALLYSLIDASNGFFKCPVAPRVRSRVNIPFRICDPDSGKPSEELEAAFLGAAEAKGLMSLKGHRSVGGLRASLYNATTVEETRVLAAFLTEFQQAHTKQ